jgi:IclR family pca regulon transcriptional regulator
VPTGGWEFHRRDGGARWMAGQNMANTRIKGRQSPRPREASPATALAAFGGDSDFMMSLARGLLVLSTFSTHPDGLTISQASAITGLSRATVRRCLYTLESIGYVGCVGKTFKPRPKLHMLSSAYIASTSLAEQAQPVLESLRDQIQESCSLGILDSGGEIVYIARCETKRIMSIALKVGSQLPAYCTSMGRVLLAHLPEAELKAYLDHTTFEKRTEYTIVSRNRLREILAEVRSANYALVDQELELGLRSVAAPVFDGSGRVVAAMNVGMNVAQIRLKGLRERIVPALVAAARELSTILQ